MYMESGGSWLSEVEEESFNEKINPSLVRAIREGMSFSRHLSKRCRNDYFHCRNDIQHRSGKRIDNTDALLKESYKPFPSRIAAHFTDRGWETHFFTPALTCGINSQPLLKRAGFRTLLE